MNVELPEGFEGILLTGTKSLEQRLAIGFEGVLLTYSLDTVFIDVVNGLRRPIAGCTVTGEFNSEERTGITNAQGHVILELDSITTLMIQKDHYSITYDYDRSSDFATPLVVFQPHMLE